VPGYAEFTAARGTAEQQPRGHCPKVSGFLWPGVWFSEAGHGLAACRSRRRDEIRWSL